MSTNIAGRMKKISFFAGIGFFGFESEVFSSLFADVVNLESKGETDVRFANGIVVGSSKNAIGKDSIEDIEPCCLIGREKPFPLWSLTPLFLNAIDLSDMPAFSRLAFNIGTHAHACAQ